MHFPTVSTVTLFIALYFVQTTRPQSIIDAPNTDIVCPDAQGRYNLTLGERFTLNIPGNNSQGICKGVQYKYTINVPPQFAFFVDFPVFQIERNDNLTFSTEGKVQRLTLNTSLVLSNHSSYEIDFFAPLEDAESDVHQVQISLRVEPIPRQNVSICSNMETIDSSSLKQYDVQEYSFSSCKGNLAVFILIAGYKLNAGTITLLEGDLETGIATEVKLNEMMFLKGDLISIRLLILNVTHPFTVIVSDSFGDGVGHPCGGVVNLDYETFTQQALSYPCVLTLSGTFTHLSFDSGLIEMYSGFTFGDPSKELGLRSSNEGYGMEVFLPTVHHTITIRPLQKYKGSIDVSTERSSAVLLEPGNTNVYVYSSILVDANSGRNGMWDVFTQLTGPNIEQKKAYLELLKPVGPDDALCLPNTEKCYHQNDGLVVQELPRFANFTYIFDRSSSASLLFGRLYVTYTDPDPVSTTRGAVTSATSKSAMSTSVQNPSTSPPPVNNVTTTSHQQSNPTGSADGFCPILTIVLSLIFVLSTF